MIEHTYRNYAVEQRDGLFYVPALRQTFQTEPLAHAAINRDIARGEAIIRANADQNAYWQSVGGRTDGVTEVVGFNERWEIMLRGLPC